MNLHRRLAIVLLALLVVVLPSSEVVSGVFADRGFSPGLGATAGIYIGATWSPQVSIARSALRELRERMARYAYPTGLLITGPMEQDCRAPAGIEEAWLLEKLYGPPQRWVLDIVPIYALTTLRVDPGQLFHVEPVLGLTVGLLTSKTVSRLSIELHGDTIRVHELDA